MLRVKNWSRYQHYKDRCPPWIKLATDTFQNYEFSRLQDASKLLAVCIWTIAARSKDGEVPDDFDWLKSQSCLGSAVKPEHLKELINQGFLETASGLLADCEQTACSEREAERETEAEKNDSPRRSEPSSGTPIPEFSFRCDGKVPTWHLTQEYLVELETAFPHLNVLAEVRKALAWTRVNPEKQKTARGMPAFLFRWLGKAQNSGSTAQSKPARLSRPLGPSVVAELEKWKRIDGEGGTT